MFQDTFPKHPTPHVYQHSMTDEMVNMYNKRDNAGLCLLVDQYFDEAKQASGDAQKLAYGRLLCAVGLLDSLQGGKACMVLCDFVNF